MRLWTNQIQQTPSTQPLSIWGIKQYIMALSAQGSQLPDPASYLYDAPCQHRRASYLYNAPCQPRGASYRASDGLLTQQTRCTHQENKSSFHWAYSNFRIPVFDGYYCACAVIQWAGLKLRYHATTHLFRDWSGGVPDGSYVIVVSISFNTICK